MKRKRRTTVVIIYGPPGVGKLTVAKELAKMTGFKLFHNHLTYDAVHSVFPFGHPSHSKLVSKIRLQTFEEAAKQKIPGIIFTVVYAKKVDDAIAQRTAHAVEKHGGRVLYVQLFCDRNELYKRIRSASRQRFAKIKTIKILKKVMTDYDVFAPVSFRKSFHIDNTNLSPRRCALKIKVHYHLPSVTS